MAPQLLQRIEYSRKCDIWSLGVILYELIFGQVPWQGKNEALILENIMSRPLTFPLPTSSAAKDILSRMLAISEAQRASLE
jgi:serine/threonine protein kinase